MFDPKTLNSQRITESQDNAGWRGAQEASVSNLLLKAAPAWGQTRWLRTLSSQVLKNSMQRKFTAFLSSLLHRLRVIMGKMVFLIFHLNLSCSNLHVLCLILLQHTLVKSLALSSGAFIVMGLFLPRCKTLYLSLLDFIRFLLAFQPIKVPANGRSALNLQTGSTWNLVSPENLRKVCSITSSRSLVKVINRTGPCTCHMPLSVTRIDKPNHPTISLSCLSIQNVMSHTR